jgi:hypothetical protein
MLFSALALSSLFWAAPPAAIELTVQSRGATLAATLQLPSTGRAPFPAIVLAHGSGRTTRDQMRWMAEPFMSMGLAVLTYDKRGVGGSTGTYVNVGTARSVEVFGDLSDDALACVAALKARKGWIVPLAASKSKDVAFLVITSGPAVTVGEEMEYSRLAGEDPGSIKGLADSEIDRQMRQFKGPHGYDPVPVLEKLGTPSIWIEGEKDRSVPMVQTLATLDRLKRAGRPISLVILPGAGHALYNPVTGERRNYWPDVQKWLSAQKIIGAR